jgi:predicted amidophosphoribosyltransferase
MAAYEHEGPARSLVHDLKYRGLVDYAGMVADILAPRLPRLPLVPIPRAWSRQLVYGIDPAREIARSLSERMGVPVLELLRPPLHSRRRAGGDHRRPPPRFGLNRPTTLRFLLVDDVVTTGGTVLAAGKILGFDRLALVVAANAADRCLVSRNPE